MKSTHHLFLRPAALATSIVLTLAQANAENYTWDADTGTAGAQDGSDIVGDIWGVTGEQGNWLTTIDDQDWADANTATFGAGTDGTYAVTVGGPISVAAGSLATGGLNFLNSGYTLSASSAQTITIGTAGADTCVRVASGKSATIGSNITINRPGVTGSGALNIVGGGTLQVDTGGSMTSLQGGSASEVAGGSTLLINGGSVSYATSFVIGQFTAGFGVNGTVQVDSGSLSIVANNLIVGRVAGDTSNLTINNGTVSANSGIVRIDNGIANIALNGGTLSTKQISRSGGTLNLSFDGGTLKAASSSNVPFLNTNFTSATINGNGGTIDTNGQNISISQNLLAGTGSGGFTKQGVGTLTLTGTGHNYGGSTTVSEGTLSIGTAYLADASSVIIAIGAKMNLTFTGEDTVASVKLGPTTYTAPGLYNATTYPDFFTGGGSLVIPPAATGYASWASTNEVLEGENGDDDKDGISNLVEYALGLDPQAGDPAPGTFTGNTLTFTKGTEAKTALDVTYKIQTSTTMAAGSWSNAAATETTDNISFLLPPNEPGGKLFGRLKVTKP